MKAFKNVILASILLGFMSCSNEKNKEEQEKEVYQWSKQEANEDFDNSSAGIYIGMAKDNLVAFSLDLKNDEENVGGKLFYYGEEFELTPEEALLNMVPGEIVEGSFSFERGELNISIKADGTISDVFISNLVQPEIGEVKSFYPDEVVLLKTKSTDVMDIYRGKETEYIIDHFIEGDEIVKRTLEFEYDILFIFDESSKLIYYSKLTIEENQNDIEFINSDFTMVDNMVSSVVWGGPEVEKINNTFNCFHQEEDGIKNSEYYFYYEKGINADLLY